MVRTHRNSLTAPGQGGPGRCSPGNRSRSVRSLPGGSRPCKTRSTSSRDAAQAPGTEPPGDGGPQLTGLVLTLAVSGNIVRVALKRAARELPAHPRAERVVHEQVSQQRRDHAPNATGNFCFEVT